MEAMLYTGELTLTDAITRWRQRSSIVIVKLGPDGSVWVSPKGDIHRDAPHVKVVDTTGAGDAFNGGFATGLARGLDPAAAVRLGCAVAGISVTRPGTAPSRAAQIAATTSPA